MGHLLKIKCVDSRVNVNILAATGVPFTLLTVQVQVRNLALTHTKRITVYEWPQPRKSLVKEVNKGKKPFKGKT